MKYKSYLLVIALLAIFARTQATNEPTLSLQQNEIVEIMAAKETYAYFGDAICSLQHDLPTLMQLACASGHDAKHLRALSELVARGYTTAPTYVVKAAVEEATACIAACKANISAQEMQRIADALESYDHALQTGAAHLNIAGDSDTQRQTRGTKKFQNLIVRNQASTGNLYVGGDVIINHNLEVNNDVRIHGDEIVEGNLIVEGTTIFSGTQVVLSGDQTITGNLIVTGNTTLGSCAATNNISGTTNINTSCATPTIIGNAASTTAITGPTNINTAGTATTNIGTAGGATNIGSSASSNTVQGTNRLIGNTFMSAASGVVLTITGNATNPSTVLVGNSSTTAPALKLINNPAGTNTDFFLTIDSSGVVKQTSSTIQSGFIINGGQAGPLTIATTNSSSIAIGNCTGSNDIEGTTTINTSCTTPTTIGNASSTTTITGPINVNTNGATATTNIGSLGTGRVNIGNATGNTIVTGNAGIGTSTPITQLNVVQNNPLSVSSVTTGIVGNAVYVQGRYAYVAGSAVLQVYDVSNPTTPNLIGSVATGSSAQGLYVEGRYAYVVNLAANTLQVFDISNPAAPTSVGSASTGAGTGPFSVYVQGRYAYVINNTSQTLQIFDVYNPTAPTSVVSVATGIDPRSVYVQGRYAYLVNQDSNTLQIFDVSDPTAPTSVGSAATGSAPTSVYVQGRYAYVVNLTANTLQIFDISNPTAPTSVGSVSAGAGTGVVAIYVQGRYAYVVNNTANTLLVFDVSNPTAPTSVGSSAAGSAPLSVYIQGRYAYVATSGTPRALQVLDLGGAYIQQMEIGGLEVGTLQTRENLTVNNDLDVKGGATIGRTLQVSGNVGVTGVVTQTSDARKKKVVGDISQVMAAIHKLHPVKYKWSPDAQKANINLDDKLQFGFLAQEVQKVFPELVTQDSTGDFVLNYTGLTPILTAALQEQSTVIGQLLSRIEKLEKAA